MQGSLTAWVAAANNVAASCLAHRFAALCNLGDDGIGLQGPDRTISATQETLELGGSIRDTTGRDKENELKLLISP